MFYLALEGKPAGPFGLDELRDGWKQRVLPDDTLFWQEGMVEWLPLDTIRDLLDEQILSRPRPMLLAGFWTRLAATAVDFVILGTAGYISSIVFFSYYTALGLFGPFFGLALAAAYFGIQDSRISRGQTLGKRLLRIRVEGADAKSLAPARSVARTAIFWAPCAWYGLLQLGIVTDPRALAILYSPLFAFLGAQASLYVFSRRTRQMLHDLATESYVVRDRSPRPAIVPVTWPGHFAMAAGVAVAMLIFGVSTLAFIQVQSTPRLIAVKKAEIALREIKTIIASDTVTPTAVKGAKPHRVYSIVARLRGRPPVMENEAAKIAAVAIKADPSIARADRLNITLLYGYNIGISSETISYSDSLPPADWASRGAP